MTNEAINIAIAESQGIEVLTGTSASGRMGRKKGWGDGDWKMLPKYSSDLNAMRDAVAWLRKQGRTWDYRNYADSVRKIVAIENSKLDADAIWDGDATALQRAEAYLRVIGKWTETKGTK